MSSLRFLGEADREEKQSIDISQARNFPFFQSRRLEGQIAMQNLRKKVSVIMPVYNEEKCIYSSILETTRTLNSLGYDYEIIVVDDGSTDHTYQEAIKASLELDKVKVVKSISNRGKGWVLKHGFQFAKGDFVVFLDGDLDLHPRRIETFFEIMRKTDSDVVIGSKRHPLSIVNYPLTRRMLSFFYHLTVGILFRLFITDTQVGIKLWKHEVLEKIFSKVLVKRYALDLELLANARRLGYKVREAPITLNFRRENPWGRIRLKDIYKIGIDTLAIFYRMYILRYYDKH